MIVNLGRAKEIVDSPNEIEVLHQGVSVWIEDVNEGSATARVSTRNQPEVEKVVAVTELEEIR
jgi:small acid-soluble spore protein H (minor)